MPKSATDVMEEIIFSAMIDSIMSLKARSAGMPNTLLRDLNAIHANVTLADLPAEVQAAVRQNVRTAFTRLLKEGYSVTAGASPPPRTPPPRRDAGPHAPRPPRKRDDAGPPRNPGRPGRKPPPGRG